MSKELDAVLAGFGRERQWLLPALHAVQHAEGYLSEAALAAMVAHLRVVGGGGRGSRNHAVGVRQARCGWAPPWTMRPFSSWRERVAPTPAHRPPRRVPGITLESAE